jgi:hypothetical protein
MSQYAADAADAQSRASHSNLSVPNAQMGNDATVVEQEA